MSFTLLPRLWETIIHRNVTSVDILYRSIYPLREQFHLTYPDTIDGFSEFLVEEITRRKYTCLYNYPQHAIRQALGIRATNLSRKINDKRGVVEQ